MKLYTLSRTSIYREAWRLAVRLARARRHARKAIKRAIIVSWVHSTGDDKETIRKHPVIRAWLSMMDWK